jgi:hypothetical protein
MVLLSRPYSYLGRTITAAAHIHDHGGRAGIRSRRKRMRTITAGAHAHDLGDGADTRSRQRRSRWRTRDALAGVHAGAVAGTVVSTTAVAAQMYDHGVTQIHDGGGRADARRRRRLRRYTTTTDAQIHNHDNGANIRSRRHVNARRRRLRRYTITTNT